MCVRVSVYVCAKESVRECERESEIHRYIRTY